MSVLVPDTSSLIVLTKANLLHLLKALGDAVVVLEPVRRELHAHSDAASRALQKHDWLHLVPGPDLPTWVSGLGAGEASVLAYAKLHGDTVVILDDSDARACAKTQN